MPVSLTSNFKGEFYYRKVGVEVEVNGVVYNKSSIGKSEKGIVGTLPEGFRPARTVHAVCQGSYLNRFYVAIETGGSISVQKYGTDASIDIPANAWLGISKRFFA